MTEQNLRQCFWMTLDHDQDWTGLILVGILLHSALALEGLLIEKEIPYP
jgi:hypothetical protein